MHRRVCTCSMMARMGTDAGMQRVQRHALACMTWALQQAIKGIANEELGDGIASAIDM